MKRKPEDRPAIENYPPLAKWLDENNARQAWSVNVNRDTVVSLHVVGSGTVLAVVRAEGHGWDLYTPCESNDIAATLADASARIDPLAEFTGPGIPLDPDFDPVVTIRMPDDPDLAAKVAALAEGAPPLVILDSEPILTRDERIELANALESAGLSPCARGAIRRILGMPAPDAGQVDLGITVKAGR